MRRLGLTPALVRAVLVGAALSFAVTAGAAPTASDRETARAMMDQGRDFRGKGDLKEALKRFQAANDIMHVPTTALEVARTQVSLGLLVEARDTVATLRQTPSTGESSVFKAARAAAEQLDATLSGRVPSVTIAVKGADAGQTAEVTIDAVRIPDAMLGLPRSTDPGHHVVTAKTPTAEGRSEFDVREGEQKPVEVTLVALSAPEPAPVEPVPAEPPPKTSHFPNTLTYVGGGVAGAGLIVGAVTGILALSKKSTLSSQCANQVCGPSSYSALDSANTLATVSDVGFAVFGAGAAVAVVSIFVGKGGAAPAVQPTPGSGLHVAPWIAGSVAGVHGTF